MFAAPRAKSVTAPTAVRLRVNIFRRGNVNMPKERTLVLIKPDAVQRGLIGEVLSRFERKGLTLAAMKLMRLDRELACRHYAAHADKDFFEPLIAFITSGPLVAVALEGENAVALVRKIMGATDPMEAAPGTIRGDFCERMRYNLVHGSDCPLSAAEELRLFFNECDYVVSGH